MKPSFRDSGSEWCKSEIISSTDIVSEVNERVTRVADVTLHSSGIQYSSLMESPRNEMGDLQLDSANSSTPNDSKR